ncbi:unnamed protein product [Rhizoctonia solani]|uniref:Uncharacterized protein n=1 Tax=Rhizoctonia solani TaxID=456999 RepID=A0A8H3C7P8_9AGAM|nr:unnamed protein product [Rhizoctonia solani]
MPRPSNQKLKKRQSGSLGGMAKWMKLEELKEELRGQELLENTQLADPGTLEAIHMPDDLLTEQAEHSQADWEPMVNHVDHQPNFPNSLADPEENEMVSDHEQNSDHGLVDDDVCSEIDNVDEYNPSNDKTQKPTKAQVFRLESIAMIAKPLQNKPPDLEVTKAALQKLEGIIRPRRATGAGFKPPKLDQFVLRRLSAMAVCLWLYCSDSLGEKLSFTRASIMAAVGAAYSVHYAKNL